MRITRQGELSFRIVHHDDVAHSRRSRAPSDESGFNYGDTHPRAGALGSARCADNAGAGDHNIVARGGHRMPQQNGSRSSKMRVASAFTNAEPLMLG